MLTVRTILRSLSTDAADSVDIVIVGAGVIGLAVARALATRRRQRHVSSDGSNVEILLLDRARTIGSGTSSRNSEVIHAGLYYPQSSLKARSCVAGRELLYDYCRDRNIAHLACGKLVVATNDAHVHTLHQLHQQAMRNGVTDTQILNAQEAARREPYLWSSLNMPILAALWSPSTGVIDSHGYMQQLQSEAEESGQCTIVLQTAVDGAIVDLNCRDRRRRIQILTGDNFWVSCAWVINCSGLWATQVARLFHGSCISRGVAVWQPPRQYFAKGTYFRLHESAQQSRPLASHLIYPVPDPNGGGLGVHLTMDCHQTQVKFGPDVEWVGVDVEDPDVIDLNPDPTRAEEFGESIRTYWPDLPDGALVPDYVGVRPKLFHPSLGSRAPFQDFVIAGPETHGLRGVIHLFGMESPGLTSSLALGDYIAAMVERGER
jgi:L-2-hydroxyglutarate oxidase LhgO